MAMRYLGETSRGAASLKVSADAVADYLIDLDGQRRHHDVTPLKLHLLMYVVQGQYLASTGERLFADEACAAHHGPVIPSQLCRFSGRRAIAGRRRPLVPRMPWQVRAFVNRVWEAYKNTPVEELRARICEQPPWQGLDEADRGAGVGRPIPDDEMAAYFASLPGERRILPTQVERVG